MDKSKDVSIRDLEIIFEDEYKIYLSLEGSIYEFMCAYENEPNEVIKDIILKLIPNAEEQIIALLGMISNYFTGELKVQYSNKLGAKLNKLQEIEAKLNKKVK